MAKISKDTDFGKVNFDIPDDFNPNRKTTVITHGFKNSGNTDWVQETRDLLNQNGDTNVIVTDWGDGAKGNNNPLTKLDYPKAVQNTKVVGNLLADTLAEIKVDLSNTTLIGHSLGAQISGEAGKLLNGKVDRIIALDPAGPGFENGRQIGTETFFLPDGSRIEKPILAPVLPENRLDPTDAQNVVVLHTTNTLGYNDPIGDFDIYVNPNDYFQPDTKLFTGSHSYAHKLYRDLLNGTAFPQADGSILDINSLNSDLTGVVETQTNLPYFLGASSGAFGSENILSLGIGLNNYNAFESFIQFDGTNFATAVGFGAVALGTLTYKNGVTQSGSEPSGNLPLTITLTVTAPIEREAIQSFEFVNTATSNSTGDDVKDGDILTFADSGLSSNVFEFDDIEFRLNLIGFSTDEGQTAIGRFNLPENQTTTAVLYGTIERESLFSEFADNVADVSITPVDIANAAITVAKAGIEYLDGKFKELTSDSDTFQITEEILTENPGGIVGSKDNDNILGLPIKDTAFGGDGNDTLKGAAGDDFLRGGTGNDIVDGGEGSDLLNGNEGNDRISGGSGNDFLRGGSGDDEISGGIGDDILVLDRGADTVSGGDDADIFIIRTDLRETVTDPSSAVLINDFDADAGELIGISGGIDPKALSLESQDVDRNGTDDVVIQYIETSEVFGEYKDVFAVVANSTVEEVKEALFSVPIADPVIELGSSNIPNPAGELFSSVSIPANNTSAPGSDDLSNTNAGADGNNIIEGSDGDDTLMGTDDNDTLSGGSGKDGLKGGRGGDTYLYSKGDDRIVISDDGGTDNSDIDELIINNDIIVGQDAIVFEQREGKPVDLDIFINDFDSLIRLNSQLADEDVGNTIEIIKFENETDKVIDDVRLTSDYVKGIFSENTYATFKQVEIDTNEFIWDLVPITFDERNELLGDI